MRERPDLFVEQADGVLFSVVFVPQEGVVCLFLLEGGELDLLFLDFGTFFGEGLLGLFVLQLQTHDLQLQVVFAVLEGQTLVQLHLADLSLLPVLLLQLLVTLLVHLCLQHLLTSH